VSADSCLHALVGPFSMFSFCRRGINRRVTVGFLSVYKLPHFHSRHFARILISSSPYLLSFPRSVVSHSLGRKPWIMRKPKDCWGQGSGAVHIRRLPASKSCNETSSIRPHPCSTVLPLHQWLDALQDEHSASSLSPMQPCGGCS
jgi:hypothetical protein